MSEPVVVDEQPDDELAEPLIAGEPLSALMAVGELERITSMDDDEQERTILWLAMAESELVDRVAKLKVLVKAATQSAKLPLMAQLLKLQAALNLLQAAMQALNSGSLVLRPPSEAVIEQTRKLTEALGDKIASAKKAQALVKLVDDISLLINRVLT